MATASMVELKTGPPILVRAVWYLLVGWWLTAMLMGVAWFAAIVIVALPLSFCC